MTELKELKEIRKKPYCSIFMVSMTVPYYSSCFSFLFQSLFFLSCLIVSPSPPLSLGPSLFCLFHFIFRANMDSEQKKTNFICETGHGAHYGPVDKFSLWRPPHQSHLLFSAQLNCYGRPDQLISTSNSSISSLVSLIAQYFCFVSLCFIFAFIYCYKKRLEKSIPVFLSLNTYPLSLEDNSVLLLCASHCLFFNYADL